MLSVANKPIRLNVFLLSVVKLSVLMLSVVMLNVIMQNAVMPNTVMLNVFLLSVFMLNAVMLNVVALLSSPSPLPFPPPQCCCVVVFSLSEPFYSYSNFFSICWLLVLLVLFAPPPLSPCTSGWIRTFDLRASKWKAGSKPTGPFDAVSSLLTLKHWTRVELFFIKFFLGSPESVSYSWQYQTNQNPSEPYHDKAMPIPGLYYKTYYGRNLQFP
jgi:hypothetical protein